MMNQGLRGDLLPQLRRPAVAHHPQPGRAPRPGVSVGPRNRRRKGRLMATVTTDRSATLFERALALIPGGVNSPVRAFGSVGGTPRFIARARGCYLWDVDGNRLIDAVGSWGPMILGHAHPVVLEAVSSALVSGPASARRPNSSRNWLSGFWSATPAASGSASSTRDRGDYERPAAGSWGDRPRPDC